MVSEKKWTDSVSVNINRIVVIGVGGGGNNTVNYMIDHPVACVDFVNINTDLQGLNYSLAPKSIQLGQGGLGTNGKPEQARLAAIRSEHTLRCAMDGARMVIVTAGLGGGTGTGAAPEIVRIAKNLGLLTVCVVTLPFGFEGINRLDVARAGLVELQKHVDALICFHNEKLLLKFAETDTTLNDAFNYLYDSIKNVISGFVGLVHTPGQFDDVQTILSEPCMGALGAAQARGVGRASVAAEQALNCLIMQDFDLSDANDVLFFISAAKGSLMLSETKLIMRCISESTSPNAHMIGETSCEESLADEVRVIVLAAKPLLVTVR